MDLLVLDQKGKNTKVIVKLKDDRNISVENSKSVDGVGNNNDNDNGLFCLEGKIIQLTLMKYQKRM